MLFVYNNPRLVELSRAPGTIPQLKWNVPEDPGGVFELTYVLQISPAPLNLDDRRVQKVGVKHRWNDGAQILQRGYWGPGLSFSR